MNSDQTTKANQVMQLLKDASSRFHEAKGVHDQRVRRLEEVTSKRLVLEHDVEVKVMATAILESLSSQAQEVVQERIDDIVTTGLQTIYEDGSLEFETEINRTGDRMEVDFMFRYGGDPAPGPVLDSIGGGIVDVASFILRVCMYKLNGCKGTMYLDEPFSQVDRKVISRVADFTRRVANDMLDQLIVVTHDTALGLSADNIIQFTGRGRLRQLRSVDELILGQ